MSLYEKHMELVDAVNDAKTSEQHALAYERLRGWREGVESCDRQVSLMRADLHTMGRFGEDRPMCCGVLSDWTPA